MQTVDCIPHIFIYEQIYIYIHLSIHADIIIFVDVGIPYIYIYTHVYTHLYAHTKAESLRQDAKERKNICTPYIDRILDDQNESRWQPSVALAPQIQSISLESALVPAKGRNFGEDSFGVGSLGITKPSFSGVSFSFSITLCWQCMYVY